MPLWGVTDTNTDGAKPKYLNTANAQNAFATNQGWVLRHGGTYVDVHGNTRTKDEILIPIRNLDLAARLAGATISGIQFSAATADVSSNVNVIVTYNELVRVVAGNPTLVVSVANTTGDTVLATSTATYASGNNTNRLVFTLPLQSNAAVYTFAASGVTIANTQAAQIVDVGNTSIVSDLIVPGLYTGANSAIGTLTVS